MTARRRSFPWPLAIAIDAVLVLAFAAGGMRNHAGGATVVGTLEIAWPFLVGLALGWLVSRVWQDPAAPLRTGLVVWMLAGGGGMIVRVAFGGGFAWSFLLVTLLLLAAFLIGWRAIVALVAALRRRRSHV